MHRETPPLHSNYFAIPRLGGSCTSHGTMRKGKESARAVSTFRDCRVTQRQKRFKVESRPESSDSPSITEHYSEPSTLDSSWNNSERPFPTKDPAPLKTPPSPTASRGIGEGQQRQLSTSQAKLKLLNSLGCSPFPRFPHPTVKACQEVNRLLSEIHGPRVRAEAVTSSFAANCGDVPSVLDALVRTILSQNTNDKNASAAKKALDSVFGCGNFEAVRTASLEEVVDALRCGGLANVKGRRIKKILDAVYEKYGKLSLDHLHTLSDEAARQELMEFDGVGPKTAACVLLFCLRRESFAVDTHVVRYFHVIVLTWTVPYLKIIGLGST